MTMMSAPETRVSVAWLSNAAWPIGARGKPEDREHRTEAEGEQGGGGRDPAEVGPLARFEFGHGQAADHAQVAGHHRQDTGREDRDDPAPERDDDADVRDRYREQHAVRLRTPRLSDSQLLHSGVAHRDHLSTCDA